MVTSYPIFLLKKSLFINLKNIYLTQLQNIFVCSVKYELQLSETQQENAMHCNNRDDLLELSFTLEIFQYFRRSIYNPVEHL